MKHRAHAGTFEDAEAVYIYPDFKTCLMGSFNDGVLVNAVEGTIRAWRQSVHDGVPEVRVKLGGIGLLLKLCHLFKFLLISGRNTCSRSCNIVQTRDGVR